MVVDTFSLGERNKHQIRNSKNELQVQDVSEYGVDPSQNLDRNLLKSEEPEQNQSRFRPECHVIV